MRRAFTIVELMVSAAIMSTLMGVIFTGVHMLTKQSKSAYDELGQTQEALHLIENIRLELASLVLNPFASAADHQGNSFLISKPNGTSIQFVTEKREGDKRQRYLVSYEATTAAAGGLNLKKTVWQFNQVSSWLENLDASGWPSSWIGAVVEKEEARYRGLGIQDLRWQYLPPEENEGRVFFRIKLVLKALDSDRMMPFGSLIAVSTPELPASISDCPCLFASCFIPWNSGGKQKLGNCSCCITGWSDQ